MLILTRRIQERILIGDKVTVTVLDVKGNQVRLGIEAPNDVRVDREEVRMRPGFDPNRKPTRSTLSLKK